MLVAFWIGGNPDDGVRSLGIMAAVGALLMLGGRSETIRGLRGDGRGAARLRGRAGPDRARGTGGRRARRCQRRRGAPRPLHARVRGDGAQVGGRERARTDLRTGSARPANGRVGSAHGARAPFLRRRPSLGVAHARAYGGLRRLGRDRGDLSHAANEAPAGSEGRLPAARAPVPPVPGRVVGVLGRADPAAELPRCRPRSAPRVRPRGLAVGWHAPGTGHEER
jgi:hypothetical protein